ncbi:MAG: ribonuclease P protein component [Phycisphaerales bacterium]|nr:ribonuclease P protein component [Phycisphaerales bacterium]
MTKPDSGADRASRLSSAKDYQRVFARRTRTDLGFITIHAALNEVARPRLGLSIGSRVGNAVRRNRVKRLVREAFRLTYSQLPRGVDLVVSARAHPERPLQEYKIALVEQSKRLDAQLRRI